MEHFAPAKYTSCFGLSLAAASMVNALLVIAKEKNPAIQAAMKSLTGHHWITHVAIVAGVFLALGFGLGLANGGRGLKLTFQNLAGVVVGGAVLGGVIIGGFYLLAD